MRTWKDVATLAKTRGLDGRFVAQPAADLPFVLEEGLQVAFVPPQTDLPRSGMVIYARPLDNGLCEVGFDSVADDASAHGLVGSHCLVRLEDLDEDMLYYEPQTWESWQVVEPDGTIVGTVVDLEENPAHPLLVVERPNGSQAYLPVVDEFLELVNPEAREIVMNLPAGILDL